MKSAARLAEIEAVDRFLVGKKFLYGSMPEFGATNFNRKKHFEHAAVWPIADDFGVVTSGQLRVIARPGSDERTTISVVFNNQCVSRLDFVPATECEDNPYWAVTEKLPHRVCGPHFHSWESNRSHVLATDMWDLPCREALSPKVRRFTQGFPWLAARINLVLTPDQRAFDVPATLA